MSFCNNAVAYLASLQKQHRGGGDGVPTSLVSTVEMGMMVPLSWHCSSMTATTALFAFLAFLPGHSVPLRIVKTRFMQTWRRSSLNSVLYRPGA